MEEIEPTTTSLRESMPDRFRLAGWFVEPSAGLLRRGGDSVHVEPKVMEVLLALAAHQGDVVSRDRLFEAVWPDVIVTDSALNRSVSDLRRVLGDDPRAPTFIETIPKVGYRLLVPVEASVLGDGAGGPGPAPAPPNLSLPSEALPVSGDGVAAALAEPPLLRPASSQKARAAWAWWGAALGATGLTAAVALWAWSARPDSFVEAVADADARILTTIPGYESQGQLAPDGASVAFISRWPENDGPGALYVQSLSASTPRKVTDDAAWPAWSPDGSALAFIRHRTRPDGPSMPAIYTVSEYGTDERLLTDVGVRDGGLSWSPDGRTLVFPGVEEDETPPSLVLLDLETGARRPLTDRGDAHTLDLMPAFSPDGQSVAFVRWVDEASSDVYVVPAAGGEAQRVTEVPAAVAGLTWSPDGHEIVFSSNWTGLYRLWAVEVGGQPQRLAVPALDPGSPTISPTGVLAYADWRYDTNIWVAPAGAERTGATVHATTLWDEEPALSPTGDRVAFISTRSGAPELWVGALDGSEPTRLTDHGAAVQAPRWSPDGRTVAYQARAGKAYDVYVVPADGGTPRAVAPHPADDVNPRWSRDGRSIYFGSQRGDGWDVWRAPTTGGEPERVTTTGAFVGEEDAAGKALYVMRPREPGIFRLDRAGGEPQKVAEIAPSDWHNWASTAAGLFVLDRSADQTRIVWYDDDGPHAVSGPLTDLTPYRPTIAVSDDGQTLAWSRDRQRRERPRGRRGARGLSVTAAPG